jgi:predicted branched-subunit amino acid permease
MTVRHQAMMNQTQLNATPAGVRDPGDPEKTAFQEALRAGAPAMPGIFAWGMVAGMAMMQSGLTLWQAIGMTFIVFAGSAQLAALPLIAAGAPAPVVFLTALVVNLRFVIFTATLGPHFAHLPWYRRLWYGYLSGDLIMGFFPQRFPGHTLNQPTGKAGFFTGITYPTWLAWQVGSVAGILLARQVPSAWGIGFAGTLALLAVMIPMVVNAAALGGVIVAGAVAVVAYGLPYKLGLLLALLAGMAAASVIDMASGDAEEQA